jgi:hypothetical protein
MILARSGDAAGLGALPALDLFALHGAARFDVVEFTATQTAPGAEMLKTLQERAGRALAEFRPCRRPGRHWPRPSCGGRGRRSGCPAR